jgi:Glycosyl hydrolase family 1
VWDVFSKKPGATFEGHTGEIACEHYHRYGEDVALLRQLGTSAYRFSVSWPRVLPQGRGAVNEAGVDFYKRLLNEREAAKITPYLDNFEWADGYSSALAWCTWTSPRSAGSPRTHSPSTGRSSPRMAWACSCRPWSR